ncbi:MAG TPA: TlpA disulfide reductase family protein [Phycisphaerae bacterium]|nr:TlpA disulfide reductase family protein [Phycisphaerae bacterium]
MRRLCPLVFIFCLGTAHKGAAETGPTAPLRSAYFGDKKEHVLPEEHKPNLVFPVSPRTGLVRLDLIRAVRFAVPRFGDRVQLVLVLVEIPGEDPKDTVDRANEIQSLFRTGLRQAVNCKILKDESGKWYEQLGKPALPHGLLIGEKNEILAREIFQGVPTWETDRVEALLNHKPPPPAPSISEQQPGEEIRTHPFYTAVTEVPLLPPSAKEEAAKQDLRNADLMDYSSIVKSLTSKDREQALIVLSSFCERTLSLSTAQRIAPVCIEEFGKDACPWAQTLIDSKVEGGASPTFFRMEGMTPFKNGSDSLEAHINVESKLISRWDNADVAHHKYSFLLPARGAGTLFDDFFQQVNAGWGDYLVKAEVTITMSSGSFPQMERLPEVKRTVCEAVYLAPHSEHYDPSFDPAVQRWSTPAERAFSAGLDAARRKQMLANRASLAAASKSKGPLASQPSADRDDADQAQSSLVGKPVPRIELQRWIRPLEGLAENSPAAMQGSNGHVVLLDFMFTGCMPCREALPKLSRLYSEHGKRGLDVISLCTSWGESGVHGLMDRLKVSHPVAVLKKDLEKAFGARAYPTYVLIDRKGVVRSVSVGDAPSEEEILKLLKESP